MSPLDLIALEMMKSLMATPSFHEALENMDGSHEALEKIATNVAADAFRFAYAFQATAAHVAVSSEPSKAAPWRMGEPPRDGKPYVAMGHVSWRDSSGVAETEPFMCEVHYGHRHEWQGWLRQDDLSLVTNLEDEIHFSHWIELPLSGEEGSES